MGRLYAKLSNSTMGKEHKTTACVFPHSLPCHNCSENINKNSEWVIKFQLKRIYDQENAV